MKLQKILFFVSIMLLIFSLAAVTTAADFDWLSDFNIRAEADPSGFRAGLAARFNIGDAQIDAVLSNVERPADAYMIFRLGEMSAKPVGYVIEKYRSGKNKGWGEFAKSLGIKPGSEEFHSLKAGNDFYNEPAQANGNKKDKGKSKGKGKCKGKN